LIESPLEEIRFAQTVGGYEVMNGYLGMIESLVTMFHNVSSNVRFTVTSISDQLRRHRVRVETSYLEENRFAN